jgi:hypothetical protein
MSLLDISNVVRVSLSGAERGLGEVNTSALAIITDEAPISSSYGDFGVYLNPQGVAEDFGSNSETYRLALAIFNQNRNILDGDGYLVVIPRDQSAAAQAASIIGEGFVNLTALTAEDYNVRAAVGTDPAADLLIGEIDTSSLEAAETSLNSTAVTAAGLVFSLSGELASAKVTLKTTATGASAAVVLSLATTGTDIAPLLGLSGSASGADAGVERAKDTILRTNGSVNYFGIVYNEKFTDAVLAELAATVQSLDKFQAVGSNLSADIAGIFTTLKDAGYTQTRSLYYSVSENDALDFAAAYMSRLMSVNFSAANTAITMHLKDIVGLVGDPGMSQSRLDECQAAGVDFYGNFGVAKVFTSGANLYSDQVYNRLALKVDLQVAGFNYLATTNTKIPQTEPGMDGLKGAYRVVMAQYVAAGVFAPGTWNGSTRFGKPEDHDRNIEEFGFFIYSLPVAQQSQTVRESRVAPVVQIAAKEAGAIHSSDVSVLVEA